MKRTQRLSWFIIRQPDGRVAAICVAERPESRSGPFVLPNSEPSIKTLLAENHTN
jgi:hypothetical protein